MELDDLEIDDIRENVCVNDEPLTEFERKHHCLFHLPTKNKDVKKFEDIFKARLKAVEDIISEAQKLPESEQAEAKGKLRYDFPFVWFPSAAAGLSRYKFSVFADFRFSTFSADSHFSSATFSAEANFSSATFFGDAAFVSTTFSDSADFSSANFSGHAAFFWSTFSDSADFSSATFSAGAYFMGAKFSKVVYFRKTILSADASFGFTKFLAEVNFDSANFSAKAHFNSATFSADAHFRSATFSDSTDFTSATFSADASFSSATFSANASFSSATFSADANFYLATFSADADFYSATFSAEANFRSATFSIEASFSSAIFSALADFTRTKFGKSGGTNFGKAKFLKDSLFDETVFSNEVSFNSATFGEDSDVFFRRAFFARNAAFQYCTAEGYIRFSNLRQGKDSKFDFQEAAFEKANRVSFHTVRLQPNWFVNVDARKFVFTDIDWQNLRSDFKNTNIKAELRFLEKRGIKEQNKRLLEIAARHLAVNAEENNRYEEAAKFRFMAMESRRLENIGWRRFLNLYWFYKWSSGYGESWSWAALILISIWFVFGLLYWAIGDFGNENVLTFAQAFGYSSTTMLLQKSDLHTYSNTTFSLHIVQTILAPLQAALLALAIRRKFMR